MDVTGKLICHNTHGENERNTQKTIERMEGSLRADQALPRPYRATSIAVAQSTSYVLCCYSISIFPVLIDRIQKPGALVR